MVIVIIMCSVILPSYYFDCREPHCVAVHTFNAEGPGELSITTGDVITLVEKVDADWVKGRLRGQEGMFPLGFVEIKVDLPPSGKSTAAPPTSRPGERCGLHVDACGLHVDACGLHVDACEAVLVE